MAEQIPEIVEVIGRYVKLEKDGLHYKTCCPFHTETSPSFYVNVGKNIWFCFGCHKGGDLIQFLRDYGKEEIHNEPDPEIYEDRRLNRLMTTGSSDNPYDKDG